MKAFLSNDYNLSQIQNRLCRYAFLTKNNLTGFPDALIFLNLTQMHKYPDPKQYPHFYHWFILIKQFSPKTINSWLNRFDPSEQDNLVNHFLSLQQRCLSQTLNDSGDCINLKIRENNSETTKEVLNNKFTIIIWDAKIKDNCFESLKRELRILQVKLQKDYHYGEKRYRLSGDSRRSEQALRAIEESMEYSSIEIKKHKNFKIQK